MTIPINPLTGQPIPLNGPGKYDDVLTMARERTGGSVVLLVIGGHLGGGFAVQASASVISALPTLLRDMADEIERGA